MEDIIVITKYVSDFKFYGIIFIISAIGHLAHWFKKAAIDQSGWSLRRHFIDQFPSTLVSIFTGFGTLYVALDPIALDVAWKATIITAFTTGFASDSAINCKFGKSNYSD